MIAGTVGGVSTLLLGRGIGATRNPDVGGIDTAAKGTMLAAHRLQPPVASRGWKIDIIGVSVLGRPIERWVSPAIGRERRRVLVVSGIHGNETITRPIAETISRVLLPDDLTLAIIPTANPDGWASGQRRNAHGIDLNRNFPHRWSRSDGGPHAASAPETEALMSAVTSFAPDYAVWIHQPLAYVAPLAGCPRAFADAWRGAVGDRRRDDVDQHGGGETWCARVAGVSTILVEAATWSSNSELVAAHGRGFERYLSVLPPAR